MWVEDMLSEGTTRLKVRKSLDEALARPLDEAEAAEYDRENWGLSDEAIESAARKDAMWGEATYD